MDRYRLDGRVCYHLEQLSPILVSHLCENPRELLAVRGRIVLGPYLVSESHSSHLPVADRSGVTVPLNNILLEVRDPATMIFGAFLQLGEDR